MAKREFLQLAHKYDPKKHLVGGWLCSEKLDGMRAFWDGGISRGYKCSEVPYANTMKDYRLVELPVATGLWSRAGKAIFAPDWFLDKLPNFACDGELFSGRGSFQYCMSTVKRFDPNDDSWNKIQYVCFGRPSFYDVFAIGQIQDHKSFNIKITMSTLEWALNNAVGRAVRIEKATIPSRVDLVEYNNEVFEWHPQTRLPMSSVDYVPFLEAELDRILGLGGEGLMLRNPHIPIEHCRSHNLLKVKSYEDDEGTIIGYVWGKATDKGSKLLGLMGALRVSYKNKEFLLSGFTEAERELVFKSDGSSAQDYGSQFADGEAVDIDLITNPQFQVGNTVRFKYRELTDEGLPKEARYMR